MMAKELQKGLRNETSKFVSDKPCTGLRSAQHVKTSKRQRGQCMHEAFSSKIVAAATLEAPSKSNSTASTLSSAYSKAKQIANKQVCIVTGASSGLGLATARKLADSGEWHVVLACRDFLKAERMARKAGMSRDDYTVMHLDLSSLESVRQFVDNFRRSEMPLDCLVCNAAVYLPTAKEPRFTADGFEISVGTNHLGHFLLANLLLEDLKKRNDSARNPPRMVIVGSITGNTNTVAGNVPPKANLGDLRGLAGGLNAGGSVMIDGMDFDGAKAYKDSKVCNMLTMGEMHRRFHKDTGVVFSSLYPGCIAETGLFREHYKLFRTIFPVFQKYITKGYVSEEEAGTRLSQVVSKPDLGRSGVYWSWNKENGSFENELSEESSDMAKAKKLYDISLKLVGLS